jgi:hypothetical protein
MVTGCCEEGRESGHTLLPAQHGTVIGGQIVAEISEPGSWMRGFVYLGGELLAVQQYRYASCAEQSVQHCLQSFPAAKD